MSKLRYTQFYIIVCSFAILATLTNQNMSSDTLIILLALGVTLLGLPHGALDFALAKSLKLITCVPSAIRFVTVYLAIAALSITFWIWEPDIALVLFLCVSIFHFSADWRKTMPLFARLSLAGALLCGPSIFYAVTVSELYTALLLTTEAANWVIQCMQITFYIGISGFLCFVFRLLVSRKVPNVWQNTEWLMLLLSSIVLNPLLHFGLYFCLLHSPKHLVDVGLKLNVSIKSAIAISMPFVILTIVLAAGFYPLYATSELNVDLLRWIFIGLFGLTMSHMLLIHFWHDSN
ncbi:MAG: Brp/Blh family beta-carotene 15,15'-dioxygenase [Pseudomonadales bacterium]